MAADILLSVGVDTSRLKTMQGDIDKEVKKYGGITKKQEKMLGITPISKDVPKQLKKVTTGTKDLAKANKGLSSIMSKTLPKILLWGAMWTAAYGMIRKVQSAIVGIGKTYAELSDEMGHVMTVTRALGESQVSVHHRMRDAVLDYARESRESLIDIARVLYHLGSAGLTAEEQLAGFTHVVDLNTATLGKMDQTARLVAGAYRVFGKSMKESIGTSEKFKEISDILAVTYSREQIELSEISAAFGYVASAAGILDINLMSLIGTIGFLSSSMLKGSKAGTSLMNAFLKMAQKTDLLKEKFGIVFDPNKPLDFVAVMEKLHASLGRTEMSTKTLKNLFGVFGIRGGRAIATILNDWNEWEKAIGVTKSTYDDFTKHMSDTMEETLPGAWKKFTNEIKASIQETFNPLGDWFTDVLKRSSDLKKEARELRGEWEAMREFLGAEGEYAPKIIPGATLTNIEEITKAIQSMRKEFNMTGVEARLLSDILTAPELISAVKEFEKFGVVGGVRGDIDLSDTLDIAKNYSSELKNSEKILIKWIEDLKNIYGFTLDINIMDMKYKKALINVLTKRIVLVEKERDIKKDIDFRDKLSLFNIQLKHKYDLMRVSGIKDEEIIQAKINDWLWKHVSALSSEEDRRKAIEALANYQEMTAREILLISEEHGIKVKEVTELEKLKLDLQKKQYEVLVKQANIFKTEIVDGIMAAIKGTSDWGKSLENIGDKILKTQIEEFIQGTFIEKLWPAPKAKPTAPESFKDSIEEGGEKAAKLMKDAIIEGAREGFGGADLVGDKAIKRDDVDLFQKIEDTQIGSEDLERILNQTIDKIKTSIPGLGAIIGKGAATLGTFLGRGATEAKDVLSGHLGTIDVMRPAHAAELTHEEQKQMGGGITSYFDPELEKQLQPSDAFNEAIGGLGDLNTSVLDLAKGTYGGAEGISDLGKNVVGFIDPVEELGGLFDKAGKDGKKGADAFGALNGLFDKIGGIAGGAAGVYSAMQGPGGLMGGFGGAMSGASMGSMLLPGIGTALGAITGGILGFLGKGDKKGEAGDEQTVRVTSKIDITNKELQMVNRNLIGIRRGFEGYIMPESAYFRERTQVESRFQLNEMRGLQ